MFKLKYMNNLNMTKKILQKKGFSPIKGNEKNGLKQALENR